jgi:serine/threonine-protein kinase HipA
MKRSIEICFGDDAKTVGTLTYSSEGNREFSVFTYANSWLADPNRFAIDPSMPLMRTPHLHRKSGAPHASVFAGCFADSEPDGWGKTVILRDHAKQRKDASIVEKQKSPSILTSIDYLLYVDDLTRIGALRFKDETGKFVRPPSKNGRTAPPLIELADLLNASRAIEKGTETAADLRYLLHQGSPVGGQRPKCTVLDEQGKLSIGKFPSVGDTHSVTKGEVLALHLASLSGIDSAFSRVVIADKTPVALIRRFDRGIGGARFMYASARAMLEEEGGSERSYTEIADILRKHGASSKLDIEQLWRRIVFNILITNVDDHLANHGFLMTSPGHWKLSPAFDLNPFPGRNRTLKLWISEESGPDAVLESAVKAAPYFGISDTTRAKEIVGDVVSAVSKWRTVAAGPDIRMTRAEADHLEEAFEHEEMRAAEKYISTSRLSMNS